jgi:hypothetical protein
MNKTAMQKDAEDRIAMVLGSLTPDELRTFVDLPYSREDRKMAMTIGFCDKLAEYGLTPRDMNAMMAKTAFDVTKTITGPVSTLGGLGLKVTLAGTILAALAGNLTGKAHHSMEQRFNKLEDKETVRLREKARRLAAQRDELGEDLASRPVAPVAKQPAAAAQKRQIVQLLD